MIHLTAYNYMAEFRERVNEDVRVYFHSGSGKVQPLVADSKGR